MNGHMKDVRIDLLDDEINDLAQRMMIEDYEVVFGHHDLQHGNILKNAKNDIIFVDFESAFVMTLIVDTAAKSPSAPTSPTTSASG